MLFSIVIPVYNVENYLEECMKSILCQIDKIQYDCEILLIDDGSTDSSGKICDLYLAKFPGFIKVYHKENQGLLATRRYGFKRANGEYIINCDSDDVLDANMLIKLKNNIIKYNRPDVILFNYNNMINDVKKIACNNIFSEYSDCIVDKKDVLEMYLTSHNVVSLCTKIYKKKCVDINKNYSPFYRVSNGEDTLQSMEIYNNAESFVYINDELYNYRIGSGMTCKFDKNYYSGFKIVLEQIKVQKDKWNFIDFNNLFAVKVMQTVGRSITQSRYNKWSSYKGQKFYLKTIREDKLVHESFIFLNSIKGYLQKDHYLLLVLFKYKLYLLLYILLYIKNVID